MTYKYSAIEVSKLGIWDKLLVYVFPFFFLFPHLFRFFYWEGEETKNVPDSSKSLNMYLKLCLVN